MTQDEAKEALKIAINIIDIIEQKLKSDKQENTHEN